jgi:hypothetical protein
MGAPSTNNHFEGATPLKVQVKFDIPLFEGHIDADGLEKWLSLLRVISLSTFFPTLKKSPSRSLKPFPMLEIGGKLTVRNMSEMSLQFLGQKPLGRLLLMPSRRNTTLLETMMTSTRDGQLCIRIETRWCLITLTYSITYAQSWVLKTLSDTWF